MVRTMSRDLKEIVLLDGVAIILIVLYHSIQTFSSSHYDANFLKYTLRINEMGLFLFTFLSGYKFLLNHINELENRNFLKKYFAKRFNRLYKPYIGYSLIIFIPEYLLIYIATYYFKLNFEGISRFWNSLNVSGIIKLFFGTNFIAPHLWYLFILLIITSICFFVLYLANIKYLYYLSLIIFLYNLINPIKSIDYRIILYLPSFVFGMYWAHYKESIHTKKTMTILSLLFFISMVQIITCKQIPHQYYIIAYGFIFPSLAILASPILTRIEQVENILYFCGKYSFQIYLFHVPIILPSLERYTVDIAGIDYTIIPYILSIATIIISVYTYKVCEKTKLNKLFE